MNILEFTDLFCIGAEKSGLTRRTGIVIAMLFWEGLKRDVKPEEKLLLEAGVCPQCGKSGWIVPISDISLDDYLCVSCGLSFFVIDELA